MAQQKFDRPLSTTLVFETQPGERRQQLPARIGEATDTGLLACVPRSLSLGQSVWLVQGSCERRAIISHCSALREGFLVALEWLGYERRKETRPAIAETATLQWADQTRRWSEAVYIKNLSEGGAQVELGRALPVRQLVRLSGEAWERLGHVRYCQREGPMNFVAGIELCPTAYQNSASLDSQD